jgi:hypothetical protein
LSPAAFDPAAHNAILVAHAEGVQIYKCKAGPNGLLAWAFREPIASLIVDGKPVGRHYRPPSATSRRYNDRGRLSATNPGPTVADIPRLKLDIVAHEMTGALAQATLMYRVRTYGGVLTGGCAVRAISCHSSS